jgi:hypothetical protein
MSMGQRLAVAGGSLLIAAACLAWLLGVGDRTAAAQELALGRSLYGADYATSSWTPMLANSEQNRSEALDPGSGCMFVQATCSPSGRRFLLPLESETCPAGTIPRASKLCRPPLWLTFSNHIPR